MTKDSQKPIGIFDSGVGGLTVYKAIADLLPKEKLIYLGDTARVPYGTKSRDVIIQYALQDSLFLLAKDVKLLVVACNTASAFALDYLQSRLKVPVIGVIEPGSQAALKVSAKKRIGIIGTEGTIRSQSYENTLKKLNKNLICISKATPLFVPLIEEGVLESSILRPVFEYYLQTFLKNKVDTLILGCTHYPLLSAQLNDFFEDSIHLVDSAKTTAEFVQKMLKKLKILNTSSKKPANEIFVTDAPQRVKRISSRFLNNKKVQIRKVIL